MYILKKYIFSIPRNILQYLKEKRHIYNKIIIKYKQALCLFRSIYHLLFVLNSISLVHKILYKAHYENILSNFQDLISESITSYVLHNYVSIVTCYGK